jgi:hypothetical protein
VARGGTQPVLKTGPTSRSRVRLLHLPPVTVVSSPGSPCDEAMVFAVNQRHSQQPCSKPAKISAGAGTEWALVDHQQTYTSVYRTYTSVRLTAKPLRAILRPSHIYLFLNADAPRIGWHGRSFQDQLTSERASAVLVQRVISTMRSYANHSECKRDEAK